MSVSMKKKMEKGATNQLLNVKQAGNTFGKMKNEPELTENIPDSLEDIDKQIQKLAIKMWEMGWLIGIRLIEIRDKYLESTEHKSIQEYANHKYSFSKTHTSDFIFIAENFKRDHARELGSKLRLLRPIKEDNDNLNKVLEWMEEEKPTYRQTEEKIKEIKNTVQDLDKKEIKELEDIVIGYKTITIDVFGMGIKIDKNRKTELVKKMEALLKEFSINENDQF